MHCISHLFPLFKMFPITQISQAWIIDVSTHGVRRGPIMISGLLTFMGNWNWRANRFCRNWDFFILYQSSLCEGQESWKQPFEIWKALYHAIKWCNAELSDVEEKQQGSREWIFQSILRLKYWVKWSHSTFWIYDITR